MIDFVLHSTNFEGTSANFPEKQTRLKANVRVRYHFCVMCFHGNYYHFQFSVYSFLNDKSLIVTA